MFRTQKLYITLANSSLRLDGIGFLAGSPEDHCHYSAPDH